MKAFNIQSAAKVFIYSEPINMSRSFRGLGLLIEENLKKVPGNGDLFLFMNEKKTYIKVIFYNRGGFCIFAKRLSAGTFQLDITRPNVKLDLRELQQLLENPQVEELKMAA